MKHHVTPLGYLATFGALLLLSGITLALSFVHLGRWSVAIALLIASTKALLVALFFMHLVEQRTTNRLVAVTAIVFVGLLVGLMVVDVDTRPGLSTKSVDRPPPLPPGQRGR